MTMIKPCCEDMSEMIMMSDIRKNILINHEPKAYLWWSDGDTMELNYCPCCGKKVEFVEAKQ